MQGFWRKCFQVDANITPMPFPSNASSPNRAVWASKSTVLFAEAKKLALFKRSKNIVPFYKSGRLTNRAINWHNQLCPTIPIRLALEFIPKDSVSVFQDLLFAWIFKARSSIKPIALSTISSKRRHFGVALDNPAHFTTSGTFHEYVSGTKPLINRISFTQGLNSNVHGKYSIPQICGTVK